MCDARWLVSGKVQCIAGKRRTPGRPRSSMRVGHLLRNVHGAAWRETRFHTPPRKRTAVLRCRSIWAGRTLVPSLQQRRGIDVQLESSASIVRPLATISLSSASAVHVLTPRPVTFPPRDLRSTIKVLFLIFVETGQMSTSTCASASVVSSPASSFLLHPMYRIRDVKGFLKCGQTGRSAISATSCFPKQGRVEGPLKRRCRRWRGCGRGVTPRMSKELVNGIALCRIDAEQVLDQFLGCLRNS